jgi:hypothetical protein
MDNDSSMSKHDLIGGILFYSDGDEVIASLANADKRGLCSGKLLSRRDLQDALRLMDSKEQRTAVLPPCWQGEKAGELLLIAPDNIIWWTPRQRRTVIWKDEGIGTFNWPSMIWRWWWNARSLHIAATFRRTRPLPSTDLRRLYLPDMSGMSVHICGMELGPDNNPWHSSDACREVEDSFFGSVFSSMPSATKSIKMHGVSPEPLTLNDFYYATHR